MIEVHLASLARSRPAADLARVHHGKSAVSGSGALIRATSSHAFSVSVAWAMNTPPHSKIVLQTSGGYGTRRRPAWRSASIRRVVAMACSTVDEVSALHPRPACR